MMPGLDCQKQGVNGNGLTVNRLAILIGYLDSQMAETVFILEESLQAEAAVRTGSG